MRKYVTTKESLFCMALILMFMEDEIYEGSFFYSDWLTPFRCEEIGEGNCFIKLNNTLRNSNNMSNCKLSLTFLQTE